MKKIFKKSIIALMVVLFSATLAMAYEGSGKGAHSSGTHANHAYDGPNAGPCTQ